MKGLNEEQKLIVSDEVKQDIEGKNSTWLKNRIEATKEYLDTTKLNLEFSTLLKKKHDEGFTFVNPQYSYQNDADYLAIQNRMALIDIEKNLEAQSIEFEGKTFRLGLYEKALAKLIRKGE